MNYDFQTPVFSMILNSKMELKCEIYLTGQNSISILLQMNMICWILSMLYGFERLSDSCFYFSILIACNSFCVHNYSFSCLIMSSYKFLFGIELNEFSLTWYKVSLYRSKLESFEMYSIGISILLISRCATSEWLHNYLHMI